MNDTTEAYTPEYLNENHWYMQTMARREFQLPIMIQCIDDALAKRPEEYSQQSGIVMLVHKLLDYYPILKYFGKEDIYEKFRRHAELVMEYHQDWMRHCLDYALEFLKTDHLPLPLDNVHGLDVTDDPLLLLNRCFTFRALGHLKPFDCMSNRLQNLEAAERVLSGYDLLKFICKLWSRNDGHIPELHIKLLRESNLTLNDIYRYG